MRRPSSTIYMIWMFLWPLLLIVAFIASFDFKYDWVGFTFILLIMQSASGLGYTLLRNVNLLTVYFIFTLVFLGLLPWLHYSTDQLIWRSFPLKISTYLFTNISIFLANFIIFLVYIVAARRTRPSLPRRNLIKNKNLSIFILLTLSGTSFIALFYINKFSIIQLLFRGLLDEHREIAIESSSVALLFGMITRLTPVFCFFYAVTQVNGGKIIKSLLLALMIISVFPTGVARYMTAFVYIPLMLIFFPSMRKASVFAAVLLCSLIFIFPFLNQFRYFSEFSDLNFIPTTEFLYAGHFDAYENFASAVEADFVSYGYQLLGSILFFIPRGYWPDKPVGSGYEMAERLGYSFNNISMPFLGEAYVNFGVLGIVIFSIFIGYAMARLDKTFSERVGIANKVDYPMAVYFYVIGALFFVLRGDFLSSFAYLVAGLSVAFFIGMTMKLIGGVKLC